MARPVNPQARSVGNRGDILKHAALVELAHSFRQRGTRAHYIDTHSFLLQSTADETRWQRELQEYARHSAYERYTHIEHESFARTGRYRCSAGLALDVLGDHCASAILGEANAETRAELREQLGTEQLQHVNVVEDAVAALRGMVTARPASLLIHIDPFSLTPELWATLAPWLDKLCATSVDAALLVYRYTRMAPSPWPKAPAGMLGPLAQIRGGPHELAAYASPGLRELVCNISSGLRWKQLPEAGDEAAQRRAGSAR
jgi:hypothetical protein